MNVFSTTAHTNIALGILFLFVSAGTHASYSLQGLSVYSDLNQQYFVAAILADQDDKEPDYFDDFTKRKIEVRVISEIIRPRRFARIWINGLVINNKSELYESTDNIIEFSRCIKKSLRRGDILALEYDPSLGTSMSINGAFIHTFAEPRFFNMLLKVLIGDIPLSSKMKKELMAQGPVSEVERTLSLYESLSPTQDRIAAMPKWLGHEEKTQVDYDTAKTTTQAKDKNLASTEKVVAKKSAKKRNRASKQKFSPNRINEKGIAIAPKKRKKPLKVASLGNQKGIIDQQFYDDLDDASIEESFFTLESLMAERDFTEKVSEWVSSYSSFPVLVDSRPEDESIKFTITLDKNGKLLSYRQFEKSKYSALNKGALKLIKKSSPYPALPDEINSNTVDLDLYFRLHWRYRQ